MQLMSSVTGGFSSVSLIVSSEVIVIEIKGQTQSKSIYDPFNGI